MLVTRIISKIWLSTIFYLLSIICSASLHWIYSCKVKNELIIDMNYNIDHQKLKGSPYQSFKLFVGTYKKNHFFWCNKNYSHIYCGFMHFLKNDSLVVKINKMRYWKQVNSILKCYCWELILNYIKLSKVTDDNTIYEKYWFSFNLFK